MSKERNDAGAEEMAERLAKIEANTKLMLVGQIEAEFEDALDRAVGTAIVSICIACAAVHAGAEDILKHKDGRVARIVLDAVTQVLEPEIARLKKALGE